MIFRARSCDLFELRLIFVMMCMKRFYALLIGSCLLNTSLAVEEIPDPLKILEGDFTALHWKEKGRPKTLSIFAENVFGVTPKAHVASEWKLNRESEALNGSAIRREYLLTLGGSLTARVLVYLPKSQKPVAAFIGLNARGNHTLEKDTWITANGSTERGQASKRWPLKMIIENKRALVTVHCADFDPDEDDGFQNGVHALFPGERDSQSWGTLGAWAWGLSRILDHLESVPEIDVKRVAAIGFSRLGKAVLWAGAQDERFAMVVSNTSGSGGAALSKRAQGETVGKITKSFPHWFCENFSSYAEKEEEMDFDQHQLLACIAPRPIYVGSASEDKWADPEGEFLTLIHAEPVYALFKDNPFEGETWPKPGTTVGGHLMRYHLREGRHDITSWDWEQYLKASKDWLGE